MCGAVRYVLASSIRRLSVQCVSVGSYSVSPPSPLFAHGVGKIFEIVIISIREVY
jgi:hypothetical protein